MITLKLTDAQARAVAEELTHAFKSGHYWNIGNMMPALAVVDKVEHARSKEAMRGHER